MMGISKEERQQVFDKLPAEEQQILKEQAHEEALREDKTKKLEKFAYDSLRDLKDNYSNVRPEKVIHGPYSEKSKFRNNWWTDVISCLHLILRGGNLPEDIVEKVNLFISKYEENRDFVERLKTKEDIDEADALIDEILELQK